ncbi:hypothetical protein T7987_09745 [Sulfitobacter faviae]|uniref:Uncharacterized protein n=1 Tax=Sulfitobacter faviae TaxID=1775881 RepID=A0ABZ0UXW1_9RHOB|nr:hypothetical protein [Sulfitobacter faviae]WPZ20471.1 hypothetical protein T7987_09745 [Sulfitobacter faviae]
MASRDRVYAKFGVAAEAAQLFETELGNLLLAVTGTENRWRHEPDPKSARQLLDRINNRETLGRLLGAVRDKIDIDADTTDQLASGVAARNRLNHGFFLRHNFRIQSEEGRAIMIGDLEQLHEELFVAWQLASALSGRALQELHKH